MKWVLFFFSLILLSASCEQASDVVTAKSQYNTYCGSCHLVPDPANIPKSVWQNNVLPDMASRLGYEFLPPSAESFSFYDRNVFDKTPELSKAMIDSTTWNLIYGYIMTLSPDSIAQDTLRLKRNLPLDRFGSSPVSFEEYQGKSMITSVQFDLVSNRFFIADALNQRVHQWPFDSTSKSETEILRFDSPVTSVVQKGNTRWIAEVGYLFPSNQPLGTLYQIAENSIDTVACNLHRPVFLQIADLNNDFIDEVIVCEFGNRSGQLSMLIKSGQGYKKINLLPLPGTIKVEIADMDADGLNDVIVLVSQGNEGIYILYNQGDLKFKTDQVVQLPPEYGSSWFQLVDYNNDGHMDIILTNGDNGDFSVFAKPYHGVRLFINDGSNSFNQEWFYPIYGATRVLAEDYDLDGDLDFAVMSFFPDYTLAPEEGFVYLENNGPNEYDFISFTFPQSLSGRWMVMDHGDFDQDGDVDIMLGSYSLPINKKHNAIMEGWKTSGVNLQLLKNNTIK